MNAKRLITEMPIEYGGAPDFIHPEKRRKIERGEHPYRDIPSFPREPGPGSYPADVPRSPNIRSYAELVASDTYPKIAQKLARYLGVPLNQLGQRLRNPQVQMQLSMANVMRAVQAEQGHERELEQAAIDVVLGLPEFEMAKQAYDEGQLRIKAELLRQIGTQGCRQKAEEPEQEQPEIPEIEQEMDAERAKRRMVNLMTQGAAISKNYAFHLADEALRAIDPDLVNVYGQIMAWAEFMYWAMGEEQQQAQMSNSEEEGAAGKARFYVDEDGIPVIHGQAMIFPVLIQELVKGMMMYLSHDDEQDPETREQVQKDVDVLGNEPWDIKFGPGVWQQVLRQIGNENQNKMPIVYNALIHLPAGQFHRTVNSILRGEPEGRQWIQRIIGEHGAEQQPEEEEPPPWTGGEEQTESARSIVATLLG